MCVCTYVYITEPLCCTPQTPTALQINYTSIKKKKQVEGYGGSQSGYTKRREAGAFWLSGLNSVFPEAKLSFTTYLVMLDPGIIKKMLKVNKRYQHPINIYWLSSKCVHSRNKGSVTESQPWPLEDMGP